MKRGCRSSQAWTRMLMGAVVVHHQMQRHGAGKFLVQAPQKFQPLLVSMPGVALTDDPPLQDLQSRKERGRAVTLVVVRHGPATALLQRQTGLRAVQGLDLTLLIYAEHDRLRRM